MAEDTKFSSLEEQFDHVVKAIGIHRKELEKMRVDRDHWREQFYKVLGELQDKEKKFEKKMRNKILDQFRDKLREYYED